MSTPNVTIANTPHELQQLRQWVVWQEEIRRGKPTKVPYSPRTGRKASSTDPATWGSSADALQALRGDSTDGIGFVFSAEDPYVGIDLDDAIDEGGQIKRWARAILDRLPRGGYRELSPSGQGLHVIVRGRKPGRRCKERHGDGVVEIYDQGRYFTVTGRLTAGGKAEILDAQEALEEIYQHVFGQEHGARRGSAPPTDQVGFANRPASASLSDQELIEKAFASKSGNRIRALWAGNTNGHPSHSEADLALCTHLWFWTGDAQRVDALFRQSGLMRSKWERLDYREATIAKAAEGNDVYDPGCQKPHAARTPQSGRERVCVQITPDEAAVNDAVVEILADRDRNLFQRGGSLVHVTTERSKRSQLPPGYPRIEAVSESALRERMTRQIRFERYDGRSKELVQCNPKLWMPKGIASRGSWPEVPILRSITESPFIRPDGSIHQRPGYDSHTGFLYRPAATARFGSVPEKPTLEEAQRCRDALLECVCDFPFEEHQIHRSVWLACVLTIAGRPAFDGPAPGFLADATTPGSGKGLLMDAACLLATGRPAPKTGWPRKTEEQEKVIDTYLIEGAPVVCFDNVTGTLGGAPLDKTLTADTCRGRILGASKSFELPNRTIWLATANNCNVGGDTSRRFLHMRLTPTMEQPELRDEFRHSDLLGWIRDERPRLLPAALTILRAFFLAVRPHERQPEEIHAEMTAAGLASGFGLSGSADDWGRKIRFAVYWLEMADPAQSMKTLREEASGELEEMRILVHAFAAYLRSVEVEWITTKDLLEALDEGRASDLKAALESCLRLKKGENPTARGVGNYFKRLRGRVFGGFAIEKGAKGQRGVKWGAVTL